MKHYPQRSTASETLRPISYKWLNENVWLINESCNVKEQRFLKLRARLHIDVAALCILSNAVIRLGVCGALLLAHAFIYEGFFLSLFSSGIQLQHRFQETWPERSPDRPVRVYLLEWWSSETPHLPDPQCWVTCTTTTPPLPAVQIFMNEWTSGKKKKKKKKSHQGGWAFHTAQGF